MATNVNPDLQKERDGASFRTEAMACVIYGGEEKTKRRRYITNLVETDPDFQGPNTLFLSRDEIYNEGLRRSKHYIRKMEEYSINNDEDRGTFTFNVFANESSPLTLQYGMFIPTLIGQGSDEQIKRWLPPSQRHDIIGTYAQTELGHGTFVRGLETTATFDGRTDEFVLNSPTKTSLKWWPGGLGKTSNYAIVMAQLYINGKKYGPHPFMVQLRDLKTHALMPGVTCGDIGPKLGFNMIDNGFLKLDHVRVSREHLLMKFSQVQRDGTYIKGQHDKLAYGAMIHVRATMIYGVVADLLAKSATIAIRYSCVRRQSELEPKKPEPQVLDFVTQQMRLFPLIAMAYAFKFAGYNVRDMYLTVTKAISAGNVDALPELHGLSSGLKAYTTCLGSPAVEECRLCCGGHGYAHYSGFAKIYGLMVAGNTYEGENYVMYLQCARYLMKCVQMVAKGAKLPGTASYLTGDGTSLCLIDQDVDLRSLVNAFRHRAKRLVFKAAQHLNRLRSQGIAEHNAWNQSHPMLVKAAEVHTQQYILKSFSLKIASIADPQLAQVLQRLAVLYGLQDVIGKSGDFLEDGYLTPTQLEYCHNKHSALLRELRPDAVALVDAFDFTDRQLGSALGTYDGNAYENMIKFVAESPLNRHEVHPAIKEHLMGPGGPLAKL